MSSRDGIGSVSDHKEGLEDAESKNQTEEAVDVVDTSNMNQTDWRSSLSPELFQIILQFIGTDDIKSIIRLAVGLGGGIRQFIYHCPFLWREIDLGKLPGIINDAQVKTLLEKVNAKIVTQSLLLNKNAAIPISGAGLEPLRHSEVLERIDLRQSEAFTPGPTLLDDTLVTDILLTMVPHNLILIKIRKRFDPIDYLDERHILLYGQYSLSWRDLFFRSRLSNFDKLLTSGQSCSHCSVSLQNFSNLHPGLIIAAGFVQCTLCNQRSCSTLSCGKSNCPLIGECDKCQEWCCPECRNTFSCIFCGLSFCSECHPSSETTCQDCAFICCSDCKLLQECSQCHAVAHQDGNCRLIIVCCNRCNIAKCSECTSVLKCDDCGDALCQDCVSFEMCQDEGCEFIQCSDCRDSKGAKIMECQGCHESFCTECIDGVVRIEECCMCGDFWCTDDASCAANRAAYRRHACKSSKGNGRKLPSLGVAKSRGKSRCKDCERMLPVDELVYPDEECSDLHCMDCLNLRGFECAFPSTGVAKASEKSRGFEESDRKLPATGVVKTYEHPPCFHCGEQLPVQELIPCIDCPAAQGDVLHCEDCWNRNEHECVYCTSTIGMNSSNHQQDESSSTDTHSNSSDTRGSQEDGQAESRPVATCCVCEAKFGSDSDGSVCRICHGTFCSKCSGHETCDLPGCTRKVCKNCQDDQDASIDFAFCNMCGRTFCSLCASVDANMWCQMCRDEYGSEASSDDSSDESID